jgi:8-oxo-dGTP pyrophosphatase MutT (NUDIX family)
MTLRDLLKETEQIHWDTMRQTGYWGRQAAGCLFVAKDTGRFCVSHRSQAVNEPGTWGTWGGAVDEGEDPAQAVRREIAEETGYTGTMKLLPMLVFQAPTGSFRYYNFLAVVETEFEPQMDWETQGYRWVDFGDWPEPQHPGLKSLLADAKSVALMKRVAHSKSTDAEPVTEIMRMGNYDDGDEFLKPSTERPILSMLHSDDPQKFQLPDSADITVFYLRGPLGSTSRAVVQNSDGRIVVSIALSERRVKNKRMLSVWSAWVSPPLRGQNLVAKIYKMLSEQLDAIIVSDDVHSTSGEKIWTKGLPKLGIHPVPFDVDTGSVSSRDPYTDPNIRLAFKTGVKNLHQYLKSNQDQNKQISEVAVDNTHGAGETPNHQEIDYLGLRVKMRPSVFLKLTPPLLNSPALPGMIDYIKQGGAIAAPQLYLAVPRDWEDDEDFTKSARVQSHEGCHRMQAILEVEGDEPVETHILGLGMRRRHMTDEMIERMQQSLISQGLNRLVTGPIFEIALTEDFTQRAKPGSRPGSLRRKAGKGKGEKITASDIKRLRSRANRMKQSDNADTRKRGVQLARQVSWYENFH